MNYKNIIFDLVNVLVKLYADATMRAFEKLGMGSFNHLRENPEALQLFQAMGIGRISNQEFFDSFRRIINPNATDKQIIDATNAMLVTIPNVKKQKLIDLRKAGYHTFLLSNTIDIHWRYCKDKLFPMGNYTADDYFDRIFTSQEMHMKKPDDEIFQTVIKEACINPNETIFIDDLEVNCIAAEKNGIHAFQNKEFDDWMELFS